MKTKFYSLTIAFFLLTSGSLFAFDSNNAKPVKNNMKDIAGGPTAVCKNAFAFIDYYVITTISPADVDGGSFADGFIDSMFVSPSSFSCYEIGLNMVTLTVIDDQGLSATCEAIVEVMDIFPPDIFCPANVSVNADPGFCSAFVTVDPVEVFDNCDVYYVENDYNLNGEFATDTYPVGTTIVNFTAYDLNGNGSSCPTSITVNDVEVPTIVCADAESENTDPGLCEAFVTVISPNVSDNCGIASLINSINNTNDASGVYPKGDVVITWTATDNSGNTASCNQTIMVFDNEAPNVVCQDDTLYLDASGQGSITAADIDGGSTDNCGFDSFTTIMPKTDFSFEDLGANEVILMMWDLSGLSGECTATVTVVDTIPPTAICQDTIVYLDVSGSVAIDKTFIDNGSFDNGTIDSMVVDPDIFDCANVGDNVVILTVIDESGNLANCISNVTVLDTIAPIAACQPLVINLDLSGNASIIPSDIDAGSTDNCVIASMFVNPASFTIPDLGDNVVILTVLDESGNTSTCTATVTVVDTIPPTAICQDTIVYLDVFGSVAIDETFIDSGSFDNGTIVSMVVDPDIFDCANVGDNGVILTVIDESGNLANCISNVVVLDTIVPVAACQPLVVNLDLSGNASIVPSDIDAGSSDNCVIASMFVNPASFTAADLGENVVELTVTDESGNSSSCSTIVTVTDDGVIDPVCTDLDLFLDQTGSGSINPYDIVVLDSSDFYLVDTVFASQTEFNCNDIGENIVVATVIDTNGLADQCSSIITVMDVENPVVICLDLTITLDSNGIAYIDPTDIDGGSSDNCGVASMTLDKDTFTSDDIGENLVTLIVIDESGNTSTCNAVVTVDQIDAVAEQALFDFSYYPNPNNGSFILTNKGANGEYLLELMDISGKIVYSEKLELLANTTKTVKANQLNKGVYLLKLTDTKENFSRTLRMIIN